MVVSNKSNISNGGGWFFGPTKEEIDKAKKDLPDITNNIIKIFTFNIQNETEFITKFNNDNPVLKYKENGVIKEYKPDNKDMFEFYRNMIHGEINDTSQSIDVLKFKNDFIKILNNIIKIITSPNFLTNLNNIRPDNNNAKIVNIINSIISYKPITFSSKEFNNAIDYYIVDKIKYNQESIQKSYQTLNGSHIAKYVFSTDSRLLFNYILLKIKDLYNKLIEISKVTIKAGGKTNKKRYENRTLAELRSLAKDRKIANSKSLSKSKIIEQLRKLNTKS